MTADPIFRRILLLGILSALTLQADISARGTLTGWLPPLLFSLTFVTAWAYTVGPRVAWLWSIYLAVITLFWFGYVGIYLAGVREVLSGNVLLEILGAATLAADGSLAMAIARRMRELTK